MVGACGFWDGNPTPSNLKKEDSNASEQDLEVGPLGLFVAGYLSGAWSATSGDGEGT